MNDCSFLEENAVNETTTTPLDDNIRKNDDLLRDLVDPVEKAHRHAARLYNRSIEMDALLTDTRNTDAVRAVSAYRDIETAIQAARNDTDAALIAIDNALVSSLWFWFICLACIVVSFILIDLQFHSSLMDLRKRWKGPSTSVRH